MLIITVFCHFDSVTLSKDICTLRDILRDQLVLKTEKIRDTTSQAFTMSLIKRTECNVKKLYLEIVCCVAHNAYYYVWQKHCQGLIHDTTAKQHLNLCNN